MHEASRQFAHVTQNIDDVERDGAAWTIYDEYEIVGEPGARRLEARGARHNYRPLKDRPALFAEFAHLEIPNDPDGREKSALAWARKYGVLGLEPFPESRRKSGDGLLLTPSDDPGDLTESFRQNDRRRDSVDAFVRASRIAGDALTLYKAAMDPGGRSEREWRVGQDWRKIRNREVIERLDEYGIHRPWRGDESAPEFWREHGLAACAEPTQLYVSRWCHPAIYHRSDGRFERGWGFVNLLGAMWLQMYWMLTAEDDEVRCLNVRCPNGSPVLPPRDKDDVGRPQKYCSTKCKNHAAQIRRRAKSST